VPFRPAGVTTNQHACNIAGYLASNVIKASLQSALDSYSGSKTIVQAFATIVGLIPAIGVVIDVLAGGVYVLYQALTSGTVSNYTDALADTKLWSDMTCAIYKAIAAEGHVTDGNYGAVLANVRAVTYIHPAVVAAIGDYVQALGARGTEQAQLAGALSTADCTSCGGWCHRWATGAGPLGASWYPYAAGWATFDGTVWHSVPLNGVTGWMYLQLDLHPADIIRSVDITTANVADVVDFMRFRDVSNNTLLSVGSGQWVGSITGASHLLISAQSPVAWTLSAAKITGDGADPFGGSNC